MIEEFAEGQHEPGPKGKAFAGNYK
jgi:hypothetical protein